MLLLLCFVAATAGAKVRLPRSLTEGMVLPHGAAVPL